MPERCVGIVQDERETLGALRRATPRDGGGTVRSVACVARRDGLSVFEGFDLESEGYDFLGARGDCCGSLFWRDCVVYFVSSPSALSSRSNILLQPFTVEVS